MSIPGVLVQVEYALTPEEYRPDDRPTRVGGRLRRAARPTTAANVS
ncbi:MAG: hypothetical protein KY462_13620 [Actinobacteria bacterium]|nr:hypothetical protein [Actinomycetota bacterium]